LMGICSYEHLVQGLKCRFFKGQAQVSASFV
jgi:hypothetical protein